MKLIAILLYATTISDAAASSGSLRGVVNSVAGQPIPGAFVLVRRLWPNTLRAYYEPMPGTPVLQTLQTDAKGRFSTVLPTGTYETCVQTRQAAYVDPCEWETTPKVYIDAHGDTGTELRLETTGAFEIEVDDQDGALTAFTPKADTARTPSASAAKDSYTLSFAVTTNRGIRTASYPERRGSKYVYTLRGPTARDLQILALVDGVDLEDLTGKKLQHADKQLLVRLQHGKIASLRLKAKKRQP